MFLSSFSLPNSPQSKLNLIQHHLFELISTSIAVAGVQCFADMSSHDLKRSPDEQMVGFICAQRYDCNCI